MLDALGTCQASRSVMAFASGPDLGFSDVSSEGASADFGALTLDRLGGRPDAYDYNDVVPQDLVRHWQSIGQDQIISHAALVAVVAACHQFKERSWQTLYTSWAMQVLVSRL